MANYNVGNTGGAIKGFPWSGGGRVTAITIKVDLSKRTVATGGFATGDTLSIMDIMPGMVIDSVCTYVDAVEGAAMTFSLGHAGAATYYHSAANGNAQGYTLSAAAKKLYTANDVLTLTLGGTMGAGLGAATLHITLHMIQCQP